MTGPYRAEIVELIAEPIRHEVTVTAEPRTGSAFELDVDTDSADLSITFSEDWAPFAQVSATAAIPEAAQLDRLDARTGCRITIGAGYVYADGTREVFPLADVGLRTRPVKRPSNTLGITASSNEARAQDYRFAWNPSMDRAGVNEAARALFDTAFGIGQYTLVSDLPAKAEAASLAEYDVKLADDLWSGLDDLAGRTGTRIYCDEAGIWRITERRSAAGTIAHELADGAHGTLIESDADLSREGWYNSVVLVYRWTEELPDGTNTDGTPKTKDKAYIRYGRASVKTGEFDVSAIGRKTYFEEFEGRRISEATANKVAAAKLRNLVTRGRSYNVTAVAAYWLRPGMTVSLKLPTGEPDRHLIQSITFRPLEGTMQITTRQPITGEITTGE